MQLTKGDYFSIPGNTIHNTVITSEEPFSVLYWFPQNANFSTFRYYWKSSVDRIAEISHQFDVVDGIRMKELNLGPYGTNHELFAGLR
jgi:oxalate decarboxylase/phosphoglucose isomerase-like protein (cupin superfamily)